MPDARAPESAAGRGDFGLSDPPPVWDGRVVAPVAPGTTQGSSGARGQDGPSHDPGASQATSKLGFWTSAVMTTCRRSGPVWGYRRYSNSGLPPRSVGTHLAGVGAVAGVGTLAVHDLLAYLAPEGTSSSTLFSAAFLLTPGVVTVLASVGAEDAPPGRVGLVGRSTTGLARFRLDRHGIPRRIAPPLRLIGTVHTPDAAIPAHATDGLGGFEVTGTVATQVRRTSRARTDVPQLGLEPFVLGDGTV